MGVIYNETFQTTQTGGLEEILRLGIEAHVMLRRNLRQEKGLVNGAIGTVVQIQRDPGTNEITGIFVKFERSIP